MNPKDIHSVVILMLENRSFDHVLGDLSLKGGRGDIEGLTKAGLRSHQYDNAAADGEAFAPFHLKDRWLPSDLPHEREYVHTQLARSPVSGAYEMSGFVKAFNAAEKAVRSRRPPPMGYLSASDVPVTRFLASSFKVCDHWFSPVPASTHPNRLMAFTGSCWHDHTHLQRLDGETLLFDWLNKVGADWRVYHDGFLSLFDMFGRFDLTLSDHFQRLPQLKHDFAKRKKGQPRSAPQVAVVEPCFEDARLPGETANDNHPRLPVAYGEALVRQVYLAVTQDPDLWAHTVLILIFDEHGGFYDHVPPVPVVYNPAPHEKFVPFESTGPRVPAIIASPMAGGGEASKLHFDHTSVLQLLAEWLTPGSRYNDTVAGRARAGIHSVSELLGPAPKTPPRVPAPPPAPPQPAASTAPPPLQTPNREAFEAAARRLIADGRAEAQRPGLREAVASLGPSS